MSKALAKRCFALLIVTSLAGVLLASPGPMEGFAFAQDGYATATTVENPTEMAFGDTARYAQVAKVKLSNKRVKITNDGKTRIIATLIPDTPGIAVANAKVKWHISDKKVASITQEGVVQGKRSGTAIVTATANNGASATAKVKVTVDPSMMAEAIPVLTYHRIASDLAKEKVYGGQNLTISESKFDRQMRWLKKNGYRTISTSEFRDWRVNNTFLPKKSVLITIDDGFYETYHVAYPILKKYKFKATSFVIGIHVKAKTRKYNPLATRDRYLGQDVVDEVRRKYPNLEFQSHTFNMHHRGYDGQGVATTWDRAKIDADFAANSRFGFRAIAYPFGHVSKNMIAATRTDKFIKIGFGYLMSWPATRISPCYNIPRFKVRGDESLRDFIYIAKTAR